MEKHKDYIDEINGGERRFMTFEARMDEDGKIEGVASEVNTTYNLGWFEERVLPGAFDDVLKDDVRVLFNHDPNQIVGRTKAGTAEIYLTPEGHLGYRYNTPNTTVGKDLEENIRVGNVDQSSFAFVVSEERWIERKDEPELREIVKIERLYDVSPVTYPASPSTTVAKRSLEAKKQEEYFSRDVRKDVDKKDEEVKPNADHTGDEKTNLNYYKRKQILLNKKKK